MASARIIIPCLDVDHRKFDTPLTASVFHYDRYLIPYEEICVKRESSRL